MSEAIIRRFCGITLLGAGKTRAEELEEALSHAPCLVAVDGGAGFALERKQMPEAVIGDMDSIPAELRARIPADRLHEISEQDSTDFDKALRSVEAPLVLGVGFLGRRVDHQLANFNVLARRGEARCILIGKHDVVFAAPPEISLKLSPGSRVSLFPMSETTGRSRGLHWPIDDLTFAPDGVIGTSNRVGTDHAGPVELAFDRPGMLIMLPRTALSEAIAALLRAPGSVHAR